MAITVNVLCYKSKTLGNGEHPLMICVCMDGGKSSVSCPLKPSDSTPLKHSTMPP